MWSIDRLSQRAGVKQRVRDGKPQTEMGAGAVGFGGFAFGGVRRRRRGQA
ncbi:MAG: MYXO-CTERM sorting domain-containing protein [Caulobacterales bacterium]